MMRKILKALMASTVVFLAACGGGGEGGGTPNGPSATLRLYPPIAGVTLPVGASGSTGVEVRGGRGPYTITSSDASVSAGLSADNMLLVSGNGDGTSEIVVYDSSLPVQQVKISATAKSVPMASSVGEAVNLAIGESRRVNMRGGVSPYTVATSDASVVTATISGATITLVGQAKGGSATVLVTDAAGATFKLSVTVEAVPTPALAVTPNAVGGVVGGTNSLAITGGKAPYTVGSSNTTVASASLSGSAVSVSLLAAGTSSITVTDSTGAVVSVAVTVTAAPVAAVPLTVLPADQAVLENSNAAVTYLITGGTAPYTAMVSPADTAVHKLDVDNAATPPSVTLSVQTGKDRCIAGAADVVLPVDIYDAKLAKKTVTLTIQQAAACP
jgi:hypothetical protein